MRVTKSVLAVAVATVAMSAGAQSAHATLASNVDYGTGQYVDCSPNHSAGVNGQHGAWGSYVGGCMTPAVKCTSYPVCLVSMRSTINTEQFSNNRVTLNTRLRYYNSSGAVYGHRDKSCEGINYCRAEDAGPTIGLKFGESASVECNGVRETVAGNRARAHCSLTLTRTCKGANTSVTQQSQEAAEAAVLCLTNLERAKAGVAAFAPQSSLGVAARGHAEAAVANPWWDGRDPHTNPSTQSTIESRIAAAGYCTSPKQFWIAENARPDGTPQQAVTWWMGSPGHRANILDPKLTDSGVGVARGSADPRDPAIAGTFVQDFGGCLNL
jgi:uncharacterized protein YkwD